MRGFAAIIGGGQRQLSFEFADRVLIAPTGRNLDPAISLDVKKLAEDITSKGVRAQSFDSLDAIIETLKKE